MVWGNTTSSCGQGQAPVEYIGKAVYILWSSRHFKESKDIEGSRKKIITCCCPLKKQEPETNSRVLVEHHHGRPSVWWCQWVPRFRQLQSYWDACFPGIFLDIFQISPSVTVHNLEVTMDNQLPFTSHCQTDKIMQISLRIHLFLSTQATQMLVQFFVIFKTGQLQINGLWSSITVSFTTFASSLTPLHCPFNCCRFSLQI